MTEPIAEPIYFDTATEAVRGGCSVTYLSDRQFVWELATGVPLANVWPADMTFSMNPERPKDVSLIDAIDNLEGRLLASPRLVAALQEHALTDVEYLPVTVLDHKGRVASKDYRIVHCCRVVDCVDQQRSTFKWDGLERPSMVVSTLVLNPQALTDDMRLIRPQFVPGKMLFRADLMQALNAQKFTGLAFTREIFGDFKVYRKPR
ncbi:MAG: hypothetical protein QM736_28350 [Vicinamibacterales bacterium]